MMVTDDFLYLNGTQVNGDMENMDVALNYENPELMSSDFFDSVLSLGNNLDEGFLTGFDDDINVCSDASHSDGVLSPQSYYSESDKTSTYSSEIMDDSESVVNGLESLDNPVLMPFMEPVQNVQIETNFDTDFQSTPKKLPTKIVIQNPSNKKFIAKPILNATQIKRNPSKVKAQILKVQPVSSNGRQVFLPLNVKSIKILNSAADVAALTGHIKKCKVEPVQTTLSSEDDDSNVISSTNHQYPPLHLTNEEKRLLNKEGIQLPTHHPLTKNEERELKRIRRKIRNKISAQDSRKRKKEYVDGLEEKVRRGSEENKNLLQRVKELQRQNKTLIAHVNKLQALICNSTTTKATPSTCILVVLLSALLVSIPNLRLFENNNSKEISTEQEQGTIRRSLLSTSQTNEDDFNMEEFLVLSQPVFDSAAAEKIFKEIGNSSEVNEIKNMAKDLKKKYDGQYDRISMLDHMNFMNKFTESFIFLARKAEKMSPEDFVVMKGAYINSHGFIEPDIDDYYPTVDESPPRKKVRYADEISELEYGEKIITTTISPGTSGISK